MYEFSEYVEKPLSSCNFSFDLGLKSGSHNFCTATVERCSHLSGITSRLCKVFLDLHSEVMEAETEVKPSKDVNQQILAELHRIRKAVEK